MANILSYWDIYPDAINDVVERCEDALVKAGYRPTEIDNWHENVKDNAVLDNNNLTNSILQEYIYEAAQMLEEKGYAVNYYINCSDTHLYINGNEFYEGDDLPALEPSEEEIEHYTKVFSDMIKSMDFNLDKQEDGTFSLVDLSKAYLGGIESYEGFDEDCPSAIVERLDTLLNESYFEDLEEAAESDLGVDFSQPDAPTTAEDWVEFMDENEGFKEVYSHEYEVMKLISSPEILDAINLNDVYELQTNASKEKPSKHNIDKEREPEL